MIIAFSFLGLRQQLACCGALAIAIFSPISCEAATSLSAGFLSAQTNYQPFTIDNSVAVFHRSSFGMTAEAQFSNSEQCNGALCNYLGPAVGVSLFGSYYGNDQASVYIQMNYDFQVIGGTDNVPLLISGLYNVTAPKNPIQRGVSYANALARVGFGVGATSTILSKCINGDYMGSEWIDESVNCHNGQTRTFSTTFLAQGGTTVGVEIWANIFSYNGINADGGMMSAYIDPYIQIDPDWAAAHPAYSLQFDAGVGNVSSVPESGTVELTLSGLVGLALWRRRLFLSKNQLQSWSRPSSSIPTVLSA